jgi:hypothetical protein
MTGSWLAAPGTPSPGTPSLDAPSPVALAPAAVGDAADATDVVTASPAGPAAVPAALCGVDAEAPRLAGTSIAVVVALGVLELGAVDGGATAFVDAAACAAELAGSALAAPFAEPVRLPVLVELPTPARAGVPDFAVALCS